MSDKLVRLPPEPIIEAIEALLEQNNSREDAARMVGISLRTLYRYQSLIGDRFAKAEARGKAALIKTVFEGATKGFTTKETRKIIFKDEDGDVKGSQDIIIEKETPPDMRAATFMLRMRFPEEFGSINRVDTKKIGSSKDQLDRDGIPQRPDDPKQILDMVLKGDGAYHVENADFNMEEEEKKLEFGDE